MSKMKYKNGNMSRPHIDTVRIIVKTWIALFTWTISGEREREREKKNEGTVVKEVQCTTVR